MSNRPRIPATAPAWVHAALREYDDIRIDAAVPFALTAYDPATDRLVLTVTPRWDRLPERWKTELLKHELGHVLLGHMAIAQRRLHVATAHQAAVFNIASDAIINQFLAPDFVQELGGVTFDRLGVAPMPLEPLYWLLLHQQRALGASGRTCGHGAPDDATGDGSADPDAEQAPGTTAAGRVVSARELERLMRIADAVTHSADGPAWARTVAGSTAGINSGGFRVPPDLAEPQPWARRLVRAVRRTLGLGRELGFFRDNPISSGLPIYQVLRRPTVEVILDCSGSIDDRSLAHVVGTLARSRQLRYRVVLFSTDTAVLERPGVERVRAAIAAIGGNGTVVRPALAQHQRDATAVLVTDGHFADATPKDIPADIAWVLIGNHIPPAFVPGAVWYAEHP